MIAMRVTSSTHLEEKNCRSHVYFHCNDYHDYYLPISVVTTTDPHYHHQGGKGHISTTCTPSSALQVVAATCRGRNGVKNRRHVHFEDEELDEMENENEKIMKNKLLPTIIKVSKQPPVVVPFWEVGNQRLVSNRSINQDTLNFRRLFSPSSSISDSS